MKLSFLFFFFFPLQNTSDFIRSSLWLFFFNRAEIILVSESYFNSLAGDALERYIYFKTATMKGLILNSVLNTQNQIRVLTLELHWTHIIKSKLVFQWWLLFRVFLVKYFSLLLYYLFSVCIKKKNTQDINQNSYA